MQEKFKGRALLPGNVSGRAIVTRTGFNTLAVYMKSIITRSKKAVCADPNNPDLYQKDLKDKILCLPRTIGSTTAGLALLNVAQMGTAPRALLFSENIDSLAAAGVILADVWIDKRIVTVDRLGDGFLDIVKEGMTVDIDANGTVTVHINR